MSIQPVASRNGESAPKTEYSPLPKSENSEPPATTLRLTENENENDSIEHLEHLSERLAVFDANNHLRHVLITSRAATAATLQGMISGQLEASQAQEIVSVIESINQNAFRLFEQAKSLPNSTPIGTSLSLLERPKDSEFTGFSVSPPKD